MEKLKREMEGVDGTLYGLCDGRRLEICKCNSHIEIIEKQTDVPILGKTSQIKRQYISIALSKDMEYSDDFTADLLERIHNFEMNIFLKRKDGVYIPVYLHLEGSEVDIILNEWKFNIKEDVNTIIYLINL